jgi:large subunit ribosomal protein L29
MKSSEIRALTGDEMHAKVKDAKEKLFNLRFQLEGGQLENPKNIQRTKKDIARLKTIIRENISTQQG